MKIIVTGSLGNISKPLAVELIAKGHDVTVISSKNAMIAEIEALGAKAAIGSVLDAAFLEKVFTGADAVYGMTPPNYGAADMMEYYKDVTNAYAEAIEGAGIKRFVYLSSYGADLEKGSGIILGSHFGENILSELEGVNTTFLRAGYLFYNLNNFMGMIKTQGIIGSNYGGEDKLVLVSPLDIATAVSEELTNLDSTHKIRYVVSDERTCNEVAKLIGEAIGKPDLQWLTFTDEQVKNTLLEHGMPESTVDMLVELGAGIHSGLLNSDYEKNEHATGKVKLPEFIREFAATYQQN
ncbi:NAD(P)H-binding protein [Fluviicola sp.]|uniref:NmrA family NAD(P)-binding protein n=1 Tax=Fluviicola sp. TaxID=1917219 RepID=UPI0031E2119C